MHAICPKCRRPNPVGNKFCGNCGASLQYAKIVEERSAPEKEAFSSTKPPRKAAGTRGSGKCLLIIVIMLLVSIGSVVGLVSIVQSSPTYKATATARAEATVAKRAVEEATRDAEVVANATRTAIAAPTATAVAVMAVTATEAANATATAIAAPSQTASAATAVARTATAQARAIARRTAVAQEHADATATIQAYKKIPPKGVWGESRGGISVIVYDFEYESAGGNFRYVALGVRVDNDTSDSIHINPFNCTLVDLTGATYDHHEETYGHFSNPLPAVDVSPGNHAYGGIVFRIPVKTGPGKFIYRDPLGPTIEIDLTRPPDKVE